MRIHHLLDSRGFGGIESHVALLVEEQTARGHEASLVLFKNYGPHPLVERLASHGLAFRLLDGHFGSLLANLRDRRPDVLHTHGYKAGVLGRLAGRMTGIPVVSTFHNGDAGTGLLRLYTALDRATALVSRNIAVSRTIASRVPNCTLIPNFTRVPDVSALSLKQTPLIGFVGRLAEEKGPDRFLVLAARLGVPAILFGDGPLRASLEATAPSTISFAGRVESMDAHWRRVGLLVISSRAEGLPLAALEAMAHGVPVAAFALGGLSELIEDRVNGFLAPPDDEAALEAAVRHWLSTPSAERAALSEAARSRIVAHYSAEAIVAQILEVYREAGATQSANPLVAKCENPSPRLLR
jgi:glycosyltransferase involved in cell wall biosynthesis